MCEPEQRGPHYATIISLMRVALIGRGGSALRISPGACTRAYCTSVAQKRHVHTREHACLLTNALLCTHMYMPFAGLQHAAAITTTAQTRLQHNGLHEYLLIRSQPGGLHHAERECVAAGVGKPRPRCAAQGGVAGFHLCYKRDALVWILWLAGTCGWLCDTRSHRC